MSKLKDLGVLTQNLEPRAQAADREKTGPRTAPVQTFNATQRMHDAEARAEQLEAELRKALESAGQREVSLDLIDEIAERKRKLTPEEFAELVENLRNNPLVHPIVVRPKGDGRYEVVSGHNRLEAFRQLERKTIPVTVLDIEQAQADINAFFANLLQPALPDYEKYLGFEVIQRHRPQMTHDEIADMVGISRSFVTKLMAYRTLPPEVIEILNEAPATIGATAAQELGTAVRAGRGDAVVQAVKSIIKDGITQDRAVQLAAGKVEQKPSVKPEVTTIRAGKNTYCTVRRKELSMRLDFKNLEDAEAAEVALKAWLSARVQQSK